MRRTQATKRPLSKILGIFNVQQKPINSSQSHSFPGYITFIAPPPQPRTTTTKKHNNIT